MAQNDIVITTDGRRFILGRFLAAGLLGVVYPAYEVREDGYTKVDDQQYAVKVEARNLSEDNQKRFRQEFTVIQAIQEQFSGTKPPVPITLEATKQNSDDYALVMEYVGDEALLTRKLPAADNIEDGLERERQALEAAQQYARLLIALHKAGYTCQDRKLGDLRWQERLVVLDWNVVTEDTSEENVRADLTLMGNLWYQLLAGRTPFQPDPLNDEHWREGRVSYGTRLLITRLWQGAYKSANETLQEIKDRLGLLQQPVDELSQQASSLLRVIEDHNRLVEASQKAGGSSQQQLFLPDLAREHKTLDLYDLAHRKTGLAEPDSFGELSKARRLVETQGDRMIESIRQAFMLSQYESGVRDVQEVIVAVEQAQTIADLRANRQLALQIQRWKTLLDAGVLVLKLGGGLRHVRKELSVLVTRMESAENQTSGNQWDTIGSNIKELLQKELSSQPQVVAALQDLERECDIQYRVRRAADYQSGQLQHSPGPADAGGRTGDSNPYGEAHKYLEQALQRLEKMQPEYRELLQETLCLQYEVTTLQHWLQNLEKKQQVQNFLNNWKRDVEAGVDSYASQLHTLSADSLRTRIANYLLRARIDDMLPRIELTDPEAAEKMLDRLDSLDQLHRFIPVALNERNAELMGNAIRTAYTLQDKVEPSSAEYGVATAYLREIEGRLREFADSSRLVDRNFAQSVYMDIKKIQAGTNSEKGSVHMTTNSSESVELFWDIDKQLEKLQQKAQARGKILSAINAKNWGEALAEAQKQGIDLFEGDDPELTNATIGYWQGVQQHASEVVSNAKTTLEELQQVTEGLDKAQGDLDTLEKIDQNQTISQALNVNARIDLTSLHQAWTSGNVKKFPQLIQTEAGKLKDIKDLNQRILFQALLFRWQMRFDHYLHLERQNQEARQLLNGHYDDHHKQYEEYLQWLKGLRNLIPLLIPEVFFYENGKSDKTIERNAIDIVGALKGLIKDGHSHSSEWDSYLMELKKIIEERIAYGNILLEVELTEMSQSNARATLREHSPANPSSNESATNKGYGDSQ